MARVMTKEICLATRQGPFARDFGLSSQIQRAAVSSMSNIAEGFERGNRGEFANFLSFSKSSCGEVRSHLYVALDVGHLNERQFTRLKDMSDEVGRVTGGLRSSVLRQRRDDTPSRRRRS